MSLSLEFNNSNSTCSFSIRWNQFDINSQRPLLYVCLIAFFTHTMFWLQFIFNSSLRQKTMQWIYAYLTTDILLLFRFFFTFIVHLTSKECTINRVWFFLVCYFEAAVDNYLNILEVYILLALNLCRYAQIAYNKNVYITHPRLLILTHVVIYLLPLISFIIQLSVGWASVNEYMNQTCVVVFTNIYTRIFNIIFAFALPISLNIFVIYASIRHVHLTSRLRRLQQRLSARQKYHRSLAKQFLIFYTVWVLLWSPNIITFQLEAKYNNLMTIVALLNYIEIALDPMIIGALDVRVRKVWRHMWKYLKKNLCIKLIGHQRRIGPATISEALQMRHQTHRTAIQIMT